MITAPPWFTATLEAAKPLIPDALHKDLCAYAQPNALSESAWTRAHRQLMTSVVTEALRHLPQEDRRVRTSCALALEALWGGEQPRKPGWRMTRTVKALELAWRESFRGPSSHESRRAVSISRYVAEAAHHAAEAATWSFWHSGDITLIAIERAVTAAKLVRGEYEDLHAAWTRLVTSLLWALEVERIRKDGPRDA